MPSRRIVKHLVGVEKCLSGLRKTRVCPICAAKFQSVGKCVSHWMDLHLNQMYSKKRSTRHWMGANSTVILRAARRQQNFTPWAKGRMWVCRKCRFATGFLSAMQQHLELSGGRCLLIHWDRLDQESLEALQQRFKFPSINETSGLSQYEEVAKLEIDPDAQFVDLTATTRENWEKFTGCSVEASVGPPSVVLPTTDCPSVPKELLFFDVALHKRRSGLHGLRRNTTATLCTRCFQVFLEVASFEQHSCMGEKIKDGDFTRAAAVTVRNESNWPPDLGNGYRKPLCFADPNEPMETAIRCTSCQHPCETISGLHQHMVECGNSKFTQFSTGFVKRMSVEPTEGKPIEVVVGESVKSASIPSTKANGGSRSAPTTPVRHKYNMREGRNSRYRQSQSPQL